MDNPPVTVSTEHAEVVIRGMTTKGRTFRPSDWADRLAGLLSRMGGDNRLNYFPGVQPVTRAGVRCVVVDLELERGDRPAFKFLMDFARDNDLEIVPGRQAPRD